MTPSARAPALDFTSFFNVINGKLVRSSNTFHGLNPSTKKRLAEVPIATQKDLDEAVAAAKVGFKVWSNIALPERKAILESFADGFASHAENFASLMTKETGKVMRESVEEMEHGSLWIRGINKIDLPEEITEEAERTVIVRYTPLGVVGAIVPWNYPIMLAFAKLAPALVTGNTVILKPSPFAPYCVLKLAELAQHFFPPGVIQALSGDDSLGPWLTAHPGIDKISFTGSVATGMKVMETASKTLKRVTLELGGKDPAVICKDIDIPVVANLVAQQALTNAGQVCCAVKRVYVHESIYPEFREAFVGAAKRLEVGDGLKREAFYGPLQNKTQYDHVRSFLGDIKKDGQNIILGGSVRDSSGYFINPTIVDNPADDSRIAVEEPFGKSTILSIINWSVFFFGTTD